MVEKPKVKIGLGLAKIKGKKRRRRKKNSIAATRLPGAAFLVLGEKSNAKKFNVEGDDDDDDREGGGPWTMAAAYRRRRPYASIPRPSSRTTTYTR